MTKPSRQLDLEAIEAERSLLESAASLYLMAGEQFKTVIADPPWFYGDNLPGHSRGAATHYKLMMLDGIKDLKVNEITDDHAHLYLWSTNAMLAQAHEVAKAWGFDVKTIITWVKANPENHPLKVQMGMGWYWRNATEQCLFAVKTPKGEKKLRTKHFNRTNVLIAPRPPLHSEKPEIFHSMVEEMSYGPYLEMFARRPHEGWSVWGLEI